MDCCPRFLADFEYFDFLPLEAVEWVVLDAFELLALDFVGWADLADDLVDTLVDLGAGTCLVFAAAMAASSKIAQNALSAFFWVPRSDSKQHLGNRELPNPYVYLLGRAEPQTT